VPLSKIPFVTREDRKLWPTDLFGDDCLDLAYRVLVSQQVLDPYTSARVRLASLAFRMDVALQKNRPSSFKFFDKLLMVRISLR